MVVVRWSIVPNTTTEGRRGIDAEDGSDMHRGDDSCPRVSCHDVAYDGGGDAHHLLWQ